VRVDGIVGVGKGSSIGMLRKELNVEDLPRMPSLARVGEDLVDALDPWRRIGIPGLADDGFASTLYDGEGKGEANPWTATSSVDGERSAFTAEDSDP
jgi:hypothetical protein